MSYRTKVLSAFRNLHRARKEVFAGDERALNEVRQRINSEFREKLEETDAAKIDESLVVANDVAYLLRSSVVQLKQKDEETYEMRITKNTILAKNTPYDPSKEIPAIRRKKKCSDSAESTP